MRKILMVFIVFILSLQPAFADFASRVTILEKAEIAKLTDEKIVDVYEDVLVEIEATKALHVTTGFSTKQYDEYRALLKYRLRIIMEIHSRSIDLPAQMER